MKLNLACGQHPTEGFTNVDIRGTPDVICDLLNPPWPFKDDSVTEVICEHFVEHIPHFLPIHLGFDGWWVFFGELYRVCANGAALAFVTPTIQSGRAFWDPTHTRFIHEMTWAYLYRPWREKNDVDHYGAEVNFEVLKAEYLGYDGEEACVVNDPGQGLDLRVYMVCIK